MNKTKEKAFVYGMAVAGNKFTDQSVSETYPLGSKSNIDRIKKALVDKEMISIEKDGIFIADCIFELWFKREMME